MEGDTAVQHAQLIERRRHGLAELAVGVTARGRQDLGLLAHSCGLTGQFLFQLGQVAFGLVEPFVIVLGLGQELQDIGDGEAVFALELFNRRQAGLHGIQGPFIEVERIGIAQEAVVDVFDFIGQGLDFAGQGTEGFIVSRRLFQAAVDGLDLFDDAGLAFAPFQGKHGFLQVILDVFGMGSFVDFLFQLVVFPFFQGGPFDFLNLEGQDTEHPRLFTFIVAQGLDFAFRLMPLAI